VITVVVGELAAQRHEGLIRPIRSDLAPLTASARDVLAAAGPKVEERLRQMGSLPIGGAFITPGGDLPCFLIHIVTASEEEPESTQSVKKALRNGLRRAVEWELASLALPPLGMGVGHLDMEDPARAMVEILVNHLDEGHAPLELVIVVPGEYEAEVFQRLVAELTKDRFPMQN